ncbi:ABC transporter substrate-binding protein [Ottowia sp.]|uniref:ABC transporter substrate-binding protein n=1 Tax=Ottowia sp. TaxID=1898956 RepID=UPI0039E31C52
MSLSISAPRRLDSPRRRKVLSVLAAAACARIGMPAMAQPAGKIIRIGTTFDASGVEKANGGGMFVGSSACFKALNKAGGIHGSTIELVQKDDQFKPDLAKANALAFEADPSILAILHPLGTRQVAEVSAAVPGMAVVGPNTGTVALRRKNSPNTFWTRANYDQEIERLVRQAASVGQTRIGLVHSNDPLGQSMLAGFKAAMEHLKVEPAVIATTPSTTSLEVEPAAKAIAAANPQIVIVGLAGTAAAFIGALRAAGGHSTIYGVSISAGSIFGMGPKAHGVGFALIVPSPFATRSAVARRYQADMAAAGSDAYSLAGMEGYIGASVLAEGLRRAGPGASRAALMAALERIEDYDLGGIRFTFGRAQREGTHFVDIGVIGPNGRLLT